MITGIVLALCFQWQVALVAIGVAPLMMIGASIQAKQNMKGGKEAVKRAAGVANDSELNFKDANILISDSVTHYLTVASFGYQDRIVEKFTQKLEMPLKKGIVKAHVGGILFGFSQFITFVTYCILFWSAAAMMRTWPEAINGTDIFICLFCIMFGAFAAGQAQQFGPSAAKGLEAAKKIFAIIDEPSKIDVSEDRPGKIEANPRTMKGEIEFRNVWFRYPTRADNWVLRGINFTIKAKETVGLVGESGSGKSTITQLIYRFYDPQFGDIFIDGVNIKDFDIHSLRACFGLVQQEPLLFNYSIRDNILYAKPSATDDEVKRAAEVANAVEFIDTLQIDQTDKDQLNMLKPAHSNDFTTLPQGYNVACGTKGGKLSGGQKQRIAIARAIIREPAILMLDEATSALDEHSQKRVQEALERIMQDRTSLIIAHRLTTIEKCDRLLVLENGKVSEEGTFSDLRNKGGIFTQISSDLK